MQRILTCFIYFYCFCISYVTRAQHPDFRDVNFHKADSIAEVYADANLKDPEKLVEGLTKDLLTDVEKFRSIFRLITNNIHYDYESYLTHLQMETKLRYNKAALNAARKRFLHKMDRRLMEKKMAICSGYSALLDNMSRHAGIRCVTVSGYARTHGSPIGKGSVNHAWNAVQLNNRWYLCDPTWASSSQDAATLKFYRKFNKHYFLTDPSLFIANHYPSDTSWTLLYNKPTLQEFLSAPMKYSAFIKNKVNTYLPAKGILTTKQKSPLRFSFTSNLKSMESAPYLLVNATKKTQEIRSSMRKGSDGAYFTDQYFEARGTYIVHVIVNREVALSYHVHVK